MYSIRALDILLRISACINVAAYERLSGMKTRVVYCGYSEAY